MIRKILLTVFIAVSAVILSLCHERKNKHKDDNTIRKIPVLATYQDISYTPSANGNVCHRPLKQCPAPGYNCTCCIHDGEPKTSYSTTSLVISSVLLVICLLILFKAVRRFLSWKRKVISSFQGDIIQVCRAVIWLMCALVAPMFYLPELNNTDPYPNSKASRRKRKSFEKSNRLKKCQNQMIQTTGAFNRRAREQSNTLELLERQTWRERRRVQRRRQRFIQKYLHVDKRYGEDLRCKNRLISQAHCQSLKTGRELWFIDSIIKSLRMELESQQRQNKHVIKRYNQVHKQVLAYAETGAGDQ